MAEMVRPIVRVAERSALVLLLAASVLLFAGASKYNSNSGTRNNTVKVQMHNVMYHFTNQIAVHIEILQGELIPTHASPIPVFDDKNSFTLKIYDARIAISSSSMAAVLNSHVFAAPGSPLKDISIRIKKDELKVKGKLHSKGDLPFEMDGTLSVTPEGKIRIHAQSIKAVHLPVKGVMDLLGIQMANLIKTKGLPGIGAEKDDLILDPAQILPPPHIQGKVTSVRLEGENIVQLFGTPSKVIASRPQENYMQYEGNRLRFGKLTMDNTDLVLLDMDPKDPFDFYLDHYKEQLVAGYTKTTPSFGLRVYMRDFSKLGHSSAGAR